jgi:hypothetical protein
LTDNEFKKYLKNLYFHTNEANKGGTFDKLLKGAIKAGRSDFWGAYPWAFKEKYSTVTTTESQETVDLPDDLDSIISVREKTTTNGRKLVKYASDEYDRLIPSSGDLNEGTPQMYKIYYDSEDAVWKLAMYPTPSAAITLYLHYHTMSDNGTIPDKYIAGLTAAVGKYMSPPGSVVRTNAILEFNAEVERLKLTDNVDVEPISRFHDSSDEPRDFDWSEYYRVRSG